MTRDKIIEAIHAEREEQIDKWGDQRYPDEPWVAILGEEFGEVCKATLNIFTGDESTNEELKSELIQVAAVAVAWLEAL